MPGYKFNYRDNPEWTEENENNALVVVQNQKLLRSETPDPIWNENPEKFWNEFYLKNDKNFFKDRHWLSVEFPEIFSMILERKKVIFIIY